MDLNWFQIGPYPNDAMTGHYNYILVALSYLIAVLASYVALDLAGRLQTEINFRMRIYWLLGGAFAMGAGIWSMHFIAMLAFTLPMAMGYELSWTISSVLVAILASAMALYLLRKRNQPISYLIAGGVLIGIGIASMHYMGMMGMTSHVNIRYTPSIFFLSIVIAIVAAEAALWLAFKSNLGPIKKQFNLKIFSALIMGMAICGMHYTGMAAAVFTPLSHPSLAMHAILPPNLLAFLIAMTTILIISIALVASTYYRQMQTGIQNEKDFLNTMLNNLNDEIIACTMDGKITVCNNAFGSYVGNIINKSYKNLDNYFQLRTTDSEVVDLTNHPIHLALNGKYFRGAEYLLKLNQDDIMKDVIIDGQPIINSEGEALGAVIVIHDVTELKRNEKLKKEFVSIVSHELRTPLTSIKGSLSLLLGGTVGNLPEKMTFLLQVANNNSERLIRLINDILDIEKIEAGKMEFKFALIDLTQVIHDAITDIHSVADKTKTNIMFDDYPKTIVTGDPDRLIQVVLNLLSNAIRFSPAGQPVKIKMINYADTVRVSIIDHGPGIPKEFQNRIFQKFSQADSSMSRSKGGTGLGLSICKAIIEKHGGSINFESTSNQGTCFYFELAKKDYIEPPIDANKLASILICDSNPDSAKIIKKFLHNYGVVADIALTAAQAHQYLDRKKYELITTDIVLQDYDGIKFIHELRNDPKTKNLPIVIITTYISEGKEIINGLGFPIIDWIQKPFKQEELYHLLEYINVQFPDKLARILSVEDDLDISNILKVLMQDEALIDCAGTLEEASNLLTKNPYDLIVLDLKLPDGLGTDLLPAINCKTHEVIPVIVFSAYELDAKYAHLVRKALLKTKVSNERLFAILHSLLLKKTKEEA